VVGASASADGLAGRSGTGCVMLSVAESGRTHPISHSAAHTHAACSAHMTTTGVGVRGIAVVRASANASGIHCSGAGAGADAACCVGVGIAHAGLVVSVVFAVRVCGIVSDDMFTGVTRRIVSGSVSMMTDTSSYTSAGAKTSRCSTCPGNAAGPSVISELIAVLVAVEVGIEIRVVASAGGGVVVLAADGSYAAGVVVVADAGTNTGASADARSDACAGVVSVLDVTAGVRVHVRNVTGSGNVIIVVLFFQVQRPY